MDAPFLQGKAVQVILISLQLFLVMDTVGRHIYQAKIIMNRYLVRRVISRVNKRLSHNPAFTI